MLRVFFPLFLALSMALTGCSSALRGTPLAKAPKPGAVTARATTAEPGGLRVLANGKSRQRSGEGAWLASNAEGLESLFYDIGVDAPVPEVDFETYVVLGAAYDGGVCQPEIDAIEVDAAGTLTLHTEHFPGDCILISAGVARIVAVPRRILPPRFVFVANPTQVDRGGLRRPDSG